MIFYAFHRNATLHGTHQRAQIATHAFMLVDAWNAGMRPIWRGASIQLRNRSDRNTRAARRLYRWRRRMLAVQMNALMRAVPAGDIAQLATDALLGVNARYDLEIQVQMIP